MLKFRQQELQDKFTTCDVCIASVDEDHPYSPLQPPRGFGGVAVLWKQSLTRISKPILKTPSIAAVELTVDGTTLLAISTYMPCRGYIDSGVQFSRVLDQLEQLLESYVTMPTIIGGDWNASLSRDPPIARDVQFKRFIETCHLTVLPLPSGVPTFLHHNKKDSAQIDYLLVRGIPHFHNPRVIIPPLGTSDHHPVTSVITLLTAPARESAPSQVAEAPAPFTKIRWDKLDLLKYRDAIKVPPLQKTYTETLMALADLSRNLRAASEAASPVPSGKPRITRVTSPSIKTAALAKRDAHARWKAAGSPKGKSEERDLMTVQKSVLRKALRQEFRRREDLKVQKINAARDDNRTLMFKLIKPSTARGETEVLHYDGEIHTSPESIRGAWQKHYANQVTPAPRSDENFSMVEIDYDFLTHLALQSSLPPVRAEYRDVIKAVHSLNLRKAPDAMGLQAEHIRYGGPEVLMFIMIAINNMFRLSIIPRFLKEGVLSSVFKNKPPIVDVSNHRGITVTIVMLKVVEDLMLKASYTLTQSPYQRGFTPKVSPLQAAWIVQQAISEAYHKSQPVFIAYLDAKAAFDAVYVKSLLRRLYLAGIQGPLWLMYNSLHDQATSRVKWGGALSEPFPILQGVRQGGLTSTTEYKQFVDPLLRILGSTACGGHIGSLQVAAPTCADDVALVAFSPQDLQVMLQLSYEFSKREGYKLQPKKCTVVTYGPKRDLRTQWTLGPDAIPHDNSAVHIGIERDGATGGLDGHIERITSKANKAFFAKMKPGMNPVTALDVYQTSVLPVLTYGLEVLVFKDEDLDSLETTQEYLLQMMLGLPTTSTPRFAVNILLGVLPVQAIAHKKILGFFRNLISQDGIEREIISRDLALFGMMNKHSWTSMVRRILAFYGLPSPFALLDHPPTTEPWKNMVTKAVNTYWEQRISTRAATYPSLRFMATQTFRIGKSHPAIVSISSNPYDTFRSRVRLKLMTGTYTLQSNRPAFNQSATKICVLCQAGVESREHFILTCPALENDRRQVLEDLTKTFQPTFKVPFSALSTPEQLQAIIDPTLFLLQGDTNHHHSSPDLVQYEAAVRTLCFKLHCTRNKLHGAVPRRKRKPKTRKIRERSADDTQIH